FHHACVDLVIQGKFLIWIRPELRSLFQLPGVINLQFDDASRPSRGQIHDNIFLPGKYWTRLRCLNRERRRAAVYPQFLHPKCFVQTELESLYIRVDRHSDLPAYCNVSLRRLDLYLQVIRHWLLLRERKRMD